MTGGHSWKLKWHKGPIEAQWHFRRATIVPKWFKHGLLILWVMWIICSKKYEKSNGHVAVAFHGSFDLYFLGLRKILILSSPYSVSRFLKCFSYYILRLRPKWWISFDIWKIFKRNSKRSKVAWEYRRDHHSSAESAQLEKIFRSSLRFGRLCFTSTFWGFYFSKAWCLSKVLWTVYDFSIRCNCKMKPTRKHCRTIVVLNLGVPKLLLWSQNISSENWTLTFSQILGSCATRSSLLMK